MSIVFVGIDLAKNVFALHGLSAAGAVQLRQPKVERAKLDEWVAALPACTIGIEACSGAHHWGRLFAAHGQTVKLMAPKLVAPALASIRHERQVNLRTRTVGGVGVRGQKPLATRFGVTLEAGPQGLCKS